MVFSLVGRLSFFFGQAGRSCSVSRSAAAVSPSASVDGWCLVATSEPAGYVDFIAGGSGRCLHGASIGTRRVPPAGRSGDPSEHGWLDRAGPARTATTATTATAAPPSPPPAITTSISTAPGGERRLGSARSTVTCCGAIRELGGVSSGSRPDSERRSSCGRHRRSRRWAAHRAGGARATLLQTPESNAAPDSRCAWFVEHAWGESIRNPQEMPWAFISIARANLPSEPAGVSHASLPSRFPFTSVQQRSPSQPPPPAVLSASVQPHLTPTSTWPLAGERRIIYIDRTSPSLARPATTHTKISTICALSHSAAAEPRGAFPHDEHGHRGCIPGHHVSVRGSSFHLRTQPGTSEERTNKKKKGESENRKTEKRSARRKEGNPAVFIRLTASTTCRYDSTHAPTRSQETSACIAKSGLSCSRPWTWEAAEPGGGGPGWLAPEFANTISRPASVPLPVDYLSKIGVQGTTYSTYSPQSCI